MTFAVVSYQSEETVSNVMRRPYYMDSIKAREFGKVNNFHYYVCPEVWDNNAGIKVADAI